MNSDIAATAAIDQWRSRSQDLNAAKAAIGELIPLLKNASKK